MEPILLEKENHEVLSQAGQDPEKRGQILAGAREVFLDRGFDAASMGDISRAAGVSKGTLYVYFKDKVDLFTALVQTQCNETAECTFAMDARGDIVEVLGKVGHSYVAMMVRPENIATLRIVIGAAGKFPQIGKEFFEAGPRQGARRLAAFLRSKVEEGALDIAEADLESAANQFLALCKEAVAMPILVGAAAPPDAEHTDRVVRRAVSFFLKVYGTDRIRA
ncbi:TetR/AcrR family transcriptional regulator [Aquabacter cavernae]|uniref:TetR/AcrR family transcriptional regulator n=1 Tax=Aquabacter cavernae TaxID=2496029 RepID=UPI000F8D1897|nr:TetR/AcrR family transcriptional regulator [Aquabacter cavernae]